MKWPNNFKKGRNGGERRLMNMEDLEKISKLSVFYKQKNKTTYSLSCVYYYDGFSVL